MDANESGGASTDPAGSHADTGASTGAGDAGPGSEEPGSESGGLASRAAGAVESARSTLASGTGSARSTVASGTEAARSTLTSLASGTDAAKEKLAAGTDTAKEKLVAGVEAVRSNPITGTVTGPDPTGQVAQAAKGALAALPPRYAALGLSLLNEGAGQYYNGQRGKAAAFAAAGLLLSTASGMATWLPRDIVGLPGVRLGPRHPRPLLVAAWGALYTYGLWDAWSSAQEQRPASPAAPAESAAPDASEQAGA